LARQGTVGGQKKRVMATSRNQGTKKNRPWKKGEGSLQSLEGLNTNVFGSTAEGERANCLGVCGEKRGLAQDIVVKGRTGLEGTCNRHSGRRK